jgi:hypothetical protein
LLLLLLLPIAIATHQSWFAAAGVVEVSTCRQLLLALPSSSEDTIVRRHDVGADTRQFQRQSLQFTRQVTCSSVQLGT